jgi:glutathione gamma-glutamylcysteinyltransferase
VLNALAIDPGRTWRGPWRWFTDEMLDCCEPLEEIRKTGVSLVGGRTNQIQLTHSLK